MSWWEKLTGRDAGTTAAVPRPVRPRPPQATGVREDPAGSALPRFRASAVDQLDSRRGSGASGARVRLRDAFTPSQPVVDPHMFAGRAALLTTLIRAIEDQKLHVVLYGDRGIGKTSMLHVLARQATEARYLVRYASCGEETSFGDLFRSVAADVPLLFHADYKPTSDAIEKGATLADLLPAGEVTPRQVSDQFARLQGTRLLIILDEFDRSPAGDFRRQVAELIKTLSDRSVRVQLVIAGVAANLTELLEHIPSIRRNIVGLPVTSMTREEVGTLIRNGERASGLTYADEAVEIITSLAAGSPYLAGLLGQHAGLAAIDRDSLVVEPQDARLAIRRSCDEIVNRISERSRIAIAQNEAAWDALALMALAALQRGGRFGGDVLAPLESDAQVQDAVMQHAAEANLIERIEADPAGQFRFIEEGVPTYLWMAQAARRLSIN
ncbi:ATP-binding protein [Microvirga sp. SRT01]|uniref:ATP-binding protein n=1 Tax=Sphingomonas longa TaxID=2778730 RepID=A0ABS2D3E2_9SPHN|nr:ATP-binding protein [Microvirga sp. SRT01]MBM6575442.1 ATP-binding protein [Sphingomonas sp. BT552]MBR7708490.1 ATP-binding protein [Microvirga sp. SRT01]